MLILIFENIRGEAINRLGGDFQITRKENELRRAHAVIIRNKTCVDGAFLDRAKKLKVVGRAGVGLDNIDVEECERRGVVVVNTPGANTNGVAELVFAMLLSLLRKIHEAQLSVRAGKWELSRFGMGTAGSVTTNTFDLPTIGYGPGNERAAHASGEHVSLDSITKAVYGTASIVHGLIGIPVFGWSSGEI